MGNLPLTLLLILHFLAQFTFAYRMDMATDKEAEFCSIRGTHLTMHPTATCCLGQVLTPGINVDDFWKDCGSEVSGRSDTIENIGWDMYICILQKNAEGKSTLSLQEFADLVTKSYPDDIKGKINEEIGKQSVASASITSRSQLEKIRIAYYDIETAICEEGTPSDVGKIEACMSWKEEDHRSGSCCRKSYPVDILYKSNMKLNYEDSLNSEQDCRSEIHDLDEFEELKIKTWSSGFPTSFQQFFSTIWKLSEEFGFPLYFLDNSKPFHRQLASWLVIPTLMGFYMKKLLIPFPPALLAMTGLTLWASVKSFCIFVQNENSRRNWAGVKGYLIWLQELAQLISELIGAHLAFYLIQNVLTYAVVFDYILNFQAGYQIMTLLFAYVCGTLMIFLMAADIPSQIHASLRNWLAVPENLECLSEKELQMVLRDLDMNVVALRASGGFPVTYSLLAAMLSLSVTFFIICVQA